jgi:hypothetical protein
MLPSYLRAVRLALLAGAACPVIVLVAGAVAGEPSLPVPGVLVAALAVGALSAAALWRTGGPRGRRLASASVVLAVAPATAILAGADAHRALVLTAAGLLAFAALALYGLGESLLTRRAGWIADLAERQARFLDALPERHVRAAVALSAALSLFLELAVIRWHTTLLELFAFYKNFSLLACFAGLALGYALAAASAIPLAAVIPLLAWQAGLMIFLCHGLPEDLIRRIVLSPVVEQVNMGWAQAHSIPTFFVVYALLGVTFVTTALTFIPIGQLCGRLMSRGPRLPSYGANLLGSALGTALMLGAGFLWTPPAIWFAVCLLALIVFQAFDVRGLVAAAGASLVVLAVLAWPVSFLKEQIYSPYQLIERTQQRTTGLMEIRAAGHFFQEVNDLSFSNRNRADPALQRTAAYYEAPYLAFPQAKRVAVVGAGTGNDVAAALRMGAERVDAIEIDPAILRLGLAYHPEHPYSDPRAHMIVNDARSHFRGCREKYDLIVYGLLDSHALLANSSSVRLDSFVYTVEGLREAAGCLADGGAISLSFFVVSNQLGRKIYKLMTEAFEGTPPAVYFVAGTSTIIFLEGKGREVRLDAGREPEVRAQLIPNHAFEDPTIAADLSTDDWPFFYMPRRVFPFSYALALGMIAALSLLLVGNFVSVRPRFDNAAFFFMGAGFMLVETKGITELGLAFGNTWQVVGIVIVGILAMAYLANAAALRLGVSNPAPAFVALIASLLGGLAVSHHGAFPPTLPGRIATLAVLTCPIFFAGMAFSALLARARDVPGAMAMNLLGALLGGLLEYNSMYFGFRFLYWLAIGLYALALASSSRRVVERPL